MRARSFCLAVLITLFMVGCGKRQADVIKIGAILPLTGDLAVYGQNMKNGIDLALEQMQNKKNYKANRIDVIYEDDAGDPKNSVAAFQKLVSIERVPVIIGGAISSCALAVAPIADKEKVVLFSPAATSPKLTGISSYFFRNWPSDLYEGKIMADFATTNLRSQEIAVLYVNNDWGVGLARVFTETVRGANASIVVEESFEPGAVDFRSQLAKMKRSGASAVYVIGYVKELLPLLRQKEELHLRIELLSSSGFYDPQILQQVGSAAEGAIFTVPMYNPENSSPIVKEFVKEYETKYGVEPDIWSAQAYDAMNIIALALEASGQSKVDIRDVIGKSEKYEGVSGQTSFDEKGDVHKPLRFMTVKAGKFVDYTP